MRTMLWTVLVWALFVRPAFASTVSIGEEFEVQSLGRSLELAYDPSAARSLDDVRSGALSFSPSTDSTPNFGYRNGAEWAKVRLAIAPSSPPLVLEYAYPSTDLVEVAFVVGTGSEERVVAYRAGDHVDHRTWPIRVRLPAFRVPRGASEVYIRVTGGASHQMPLTIRREEGWRAHAEGENLAQALYFGALGAMLLYNALVWFAVGLPLYGSYVCFLSAYFLFTLALSGTLFAVLFSGSFWLNDHVIAAASAAAAIAAIHFMMGLLDLGAARSAFAKFTRGVTAYLGVVGFASLMLPYSIGLRLTMAGTVAAFIGLFSGGVVAVRNGERAGRWYLLAWVAFNIGTIAQILRVLGIVPTNALTANAAQVGSAVEFLLLSFALADRIKQLQAAATASAQLAAQNARLAQEASEHALAEQARTNIELKRLAKLKDEFLANTSHELRTPLNGVIGMAEAIHESRELPPLFRGKTTEILSAARRLSELVGNIMDFSEARVAGATVPLRPVSLLGLASRAIEAIRADANRKGVQVSCEIDEDASVVLGTARDIDQALRTLISNAVKFTEFGSVELRARRRGDRVEVVITDEGCGIDAARMASLFNAFEQGDGSATRKHGGTGIGLALAKKVVERIEGTITLDSTIGVGTTVSLSFRASDDRAEEDAPSSTVPRSLESVEFSDPASRPRPNDPVKDLRNVEHVDVAAATRGLAKPARVALDHAPSLPPPPTIRGQDVRRARLLVVDDDRLNRMVIAEHLRGTPFQCVEAASGAEALGHFDSNGPFDAILLDVMMPGMSGYDVCRRIRQSVSAGDVPILLLTAKQQVEDLIEGFDAGANDYVHKPIAKGELLARVSAHVSLARASLAMRRFVPLETIRLLGHEDLTEVALGDATEQRLTIVFSDIRGFTRAVERMTPSEAFEWLNRCYGAVGPEVRRFGGFIDKYIGDAVMALFPRSPVDALRAAIAMHAKLERLGGVRMGTGIHLGSTMLGTLGEAERFEATVLSDAVNVASRMEGVSKHFGARVVVTGALREAAQYEEFRWRALGRVRLKGRDAAVEIFELLDADSERERADKLEFIAEFQEGVDAFQVGRFRDALLRFERIVAEVPEDGAALAYRSYAANAVESPSDDFDGTVALTSK